MAIQYKLDIQGVDWDDMKSTLKSDKWDNGRTPKQYKDSFENSYVTCLVYDEASLIGISRALSDGVGNAYIMDMWTHSSYRMQGIARQMMEYLLDSLPGQHVYLQTDDDTLEFYEKLGFKKRPNGMEIVVGEYLKGD